MTEHPCFEERTCKMCNETKNVCLDFPRKYSNYCKTCTNAKSVAALRKSTGPSQEGMHWMKRNDFKVSWKKRTDRRDSI